MKLSELREVRNKLIAKGLLLHKVSSDIRFRLKTREDDFVKLVNSPKFKTSNKKAALRILKMFDELGGEFIIAGNLVYRLLDEGGFNDLLDDCEVIPTDEEKREILG